MNTLEREQQTKLIALVQETIHKDEELRTQYHIGEKFRFIRDRLHALLDTLEKNLQESFPEEKKSVHLEASADEVMVHVYLYNAQGLQLRSWQGMVNPKFFYDYGVNRPVYGERNHIEAMIRSKSNKLQHAYLTFTVKRDDVVVSTDMRDSLGNPLIKLKENKLLPEKLMSFHHNDKNYILNSEGELILKEGL